MTRYTRRSRKPDPTCRCLNQGGPATPARTQGNLHLLNRILNKCRHCPPSRPAAVLNRNGTRRPRTGGEGPAGRDAWWPSRVDGKDRDPGGGPGPASAGEAATQTRPRHSAGRTVEATGNRGHRHNPDARRAGRCARKWRGSDAQAPLLRPSQSSCNHSVLSGVGEKNLAFGGFFWARGYCTAPFETISIRYWTARTRACGNILPRCDDCRN